MTHILKILPRFFGEVASGQKTFEIQRDDREFRAGDILILKEWGYGPDQYKDQGLTGREVGVDVLFVTNLRPAYEAVGMVIKLRGRQIDNI